MIYQQPDLSKFPIDKVVENIHNISKESRTVDKIRTVISSVLNMLGNLERYYQSWIEHYNQEYFSMPQNRIYFLNDFLFDHITQLWDVAKWEIWPIIDQYIVTYNAVDNQLYDLLSEFKKQVDETRLDEPIMYTITPEEKPTIDNIFLGLKSSSNNNSDYKNQPSAWNLATFKI